MIDESIPVLIRLRFQDRCSMCIAALAYENGQLYAEPTIVSPEFARFRTLALDEQRFEFFPGPNGKPGMYHYGPEIDLHDIEGPRIR
jgi:hypothetical protein